jgi:uncharacterized repeat protein (TIGR03803 family)
MLSNALAVVLAISVPCSAATEPASAPTLATLYSFPGGGGGGFLEAGLVLNSTTGVLYGTTADGGAYGWGTVYQLTPGVGGIWTSAVLYSFNPINIPGDGANPQAGLVLGASGVIYGTTAYGGSSDDGTVFSLSPLGGGLWTEQVIHNFTGSVTGGSDGADPEAGLMLGSSGVLYGTTYAGGTSGYGMAFQLAPAGGGVWNEKVLYNFKGLTDGGNPVAGLVQATTQILYGTTYTGGTSGYGTVFQLVPSGGGVWKQTAIYSFTNGTDGSGPEAGVTIHYTKTNTVLYGSAFWAGSSGGCPLGGYPAGCGTVFSLTSPATTGGPWTFAVLYTFKGTGLDGAHPSQNLFLNTSGGLYGTTFSGGSTTDGCFGPSYPGCGTVFLLKPPSAGGNWTESILHDFNGDDGGGPNGVISGASGIFYGTTYVGGTSGGYGSVFQLTIP